MRALPRAVAVALLVTTALPFVSTVATVRAADVTFGTPEAAASYGEAIEFTIPYTAGEPVERLELRISYPGSIGPHIVDVPVPAGSGSQVLRYTLALADGGLTPNTEVRATWAAVTPDGEVTTSREGRIRYEDTSRDWNTLRGDVVAVHWYEGDRAFGERALEIAETAIRDTAALLGVDETEPVDFFIYGDDEAFRAALGPGIREWVAGTSISEIRTLFGLLRPSQIDDAWVEVLVTHELVHLVIDTATDNPYRGPPRWIHEGIATYLSEGYSAASRSAVESAVRSRDLLPLDAMAGQLPTDPDKAGLAYAESVSAIDHLVRVDGRDALVDLVRAYRDGLTDDEAFTRALGRDVAGFQAAWLAELGADDPQRFGPQPAPGGPVPQGWGDGGAPAVPGATPTPGPAAPSAGPAVPGIPPDDEASADQGRGIIVLALVTLIVVGAAGLLIARRRGTTG